MNVIKNMSKKPYKHLLEKAGWVCQDCGNKYAKRQYDISTWHSGICDICGEKKAVTEARDFYYFK